MRTFHNALAFNALLVLAATLPVSAQGVSEYGAAMGASSATAAAAHRGAGAARNATNNLYGGAAGALMQVSGSSNEGARTQGGSVTDDLAPYIKQQKDEYGDVIPVDPRVTVLTTGKLSNKFYSEAQQAEKAGKYDLAESLYARAIRLRTRLWGDKDPAVIKMYIAIGKVELKRKKPEAAEPFFRRALQSQLKKNGFGSYDNVEVLELLGDTLYSEKKYGDSANYFQQVYTQKERKFGPENVQTVSAAVKLGNSYARNEDAGWIGDADKVLTSSLKAVEKMPDNNAQLIAVLDAYHFVLRKEGKNAEADSVLERLTNLRVPSGPSSTAEATKPTAVSPTATKAESPAAKPTTTPSPATAVAPPSKSSKDEPATKGVVK